MAVGCAVTSDPTAGGVVAESAVHRVPVIAQLVQADEDTVRDVIHQFNAIGLPAWTLRPCPTW
jgi:hypothetical protein